MRFALWGVGAVLAGAAALIGTTSHATAGCVTCTSGQECVPGGSSSHCELFEEGGEMWCNFFVNSCDGDGGGDGGGPVIPGGLVLRVSPAGTYLASHSQTILTVDGRRITACGGFLVAQAERTPTAGTGTITL